MMKAPTSAAIASWVRGIMTALRTFIVVEFFLIISRSSNGRK
jgi:hypothetical protein